MRLGSGEDSKVNFKITSIASPGIYDVVLVTGKGTPVNGEGYDTEFLPPFDPSAYATSDYVDSQDDLKLNLSGGTLTGNLTSKTGGSGRAAFKINNDSNSSECWTLWSPGGSGTQTKYVGQSNTAHWFQIYDGTNKNPLTTAKLGYESYSFLAQPNVTYAATDAHYFKSGVHFKNGNGDLKAQISNSNFDFYTLARFKEGFVIKRPGSTISGDNSFVANPDYVSYSGRIENETDIVNKQYVDTAGAQDATVSQKGIAKLGKVAHGTSVPALETGQMFYNTSTKALLIKT